MVGENQVVVSLCQYYKERLLRLTHPSDLLRRLVFYTLLNV